MPIHIRKVDVMARKASEIAAVIQRNDTRGLPQGMDPRMFYEYSSQKRQQSATGLEGFLYKWMPKNLIGSLAFAIDPLSQFKVSATRISPVVRTRYLKRNNLLLKRGHVWTRTNYTRAYKYLPNGDKGTFGPNLTPYGDQPVLTDIVKDTTAGQRPEGSDMGEFAMWRVQAHSSPRNMYNWSFQTRWYDDTPSGYQYYTREDVWHRQFGSAAIITQSSNEAICAEVQNKALALMQENVLGMYQACNSQRRATTLFRSIAELKDLPRAVLQLQQSILHLRALSETLEIPSTILRKIHLSKTVVKDIPKEYLSYSFGWSQTYKDIRDLMLAPERISKRINFLLRRNGKASTYRSQKSISVAGATTSGFSYEQFQPEYNVSVSSKIVTEHLLKMVINATFEFPSVDTPKLREKEYFRQIGVVPTPMDVYNLVPWTWLFDWFTGFGKYLEIIETINTDKNLINWGVLSCISKGELITTFKANQAQNWSATGTDGPRYVDNTTAHSSHLLFHSHLRKDVATVLNVNAAAESSSLTAFQLSILGALISSKLKF
jgi:hypothetical protein